MTYSTLSGFLVATSDAAFAFVADKDSRTIGINPLYVPKSKVEPKSFQELDSVSREIQTGKIGLRVGFPITLNVETAFLEKVRFI